MRRILGKSAHLSEDGCRFHPVEPPRSASRMPLDGPNAIGSFRDNQNPPPAKRAPELRQIGSSLLGKQMLHHCLEPDDRERLSLKGRHDIATAKVYSITPAHAPEKLRREVDVTLHQVGGDDVPSSATDHAAA